MQNFLKNILHFWKIYANFAPVKIQHQKHKYIPNLIWKNIK